MSGTTAVQPEAVLDSDQRHWIQRMCSVLEVESRNKMAPSLESATVAAPGSPAELAGDVATRQQAAVDVALQEWEKLVREEGAANRGSQIDKYARNAGFNPNVDRNENVAGVQGIEWCGAFVGYALTQSGFKDAPSMASYQKARDYFLYRSYTGSIPNEKLDALRADQQASGSSRQYFILAGSDSDTSKMVKKKGKYGADKYGHFDADKNTFKLADLPIQAGDVALFKHGHVGIVKSFDSKTGILETIEGNTGGERADGTKAARDAVVQKKYDLNNEKDRLKFDGFGRPSAGDFNDAAPTAGGNSGNSTTSTKKRTVPGGGGYVYEQHENGKIFIVESPKQGKSRIEVKDKKAYQAILAEIGPFPAQGDLPSGNTAKLTGEASGLLNQFFDAASDAADRVGDAVKSVIGEVTERIGGAMDAAADMVAAAGYGDTTVAGQQPATGMSEQPPAKPNDVALKPTTRISASVGKDGKNVPEDVLLVKQLLEKFGYHLTENSEADAALNRAIGSFQKDYLFLPKPDERIDPTGKTWNRLIGIGRIKDSLDSLAKKYDLEPAVILAIQSIESGGNGYLPDGRPKILFEGHVFWKQLKAVGKEPTEFVTGNEDILYPKWDKAKYAGGAGEYTRLERAEKIDRIAALKSASWGEFQIMGFNHQAAGYSDVESFVDSMQGPGSNQLSSVLSFMDKNKLLPHVRGPHKNWAKFAEGYNGSGYKQNQYDTKLAQAYDRFSKIP